LETKLHLDCDSAEMYALGGLSEEECAAFELHLEHCADCRATVEELRDVVGVLPLAVEPLEPPAGMKGRVLRNIMAGEKGSQTPAQMVEAKPMRMAKTEEPRSSVNRTESRMQEQQRRRKASIGWHRYGLAGLSAAVVLLGVYSLQLRTELTDTREALEVATATNPSDPYQLNKAVSLTAAEEDLIASGVASIVIDNRGTHLIVQAENLPELQGSEAFQVWLLKDGEPTNAGTFLSHNGTGALMYTFEPSTYDTVAITQEPDAEGSTPRGSIVLAATL
jgi:anti-sigma-K factor RskA